MDITKEEVQANEYKDAIRSIVPECPKVLDAKLGNGRLWLYFYKGEATTEVKRAIQSAIDIQGWGLKAGFRIYNGKMQREDPDDPRWDKSKGLPKTADYIAVLEDLDYHFKMNICNDVVELNGEPMSDTRRSKIRSQIRDLNYLQVNVAEDAWIANAYDNRYHPVQAFLEGLEWDGEDHIRALSDHFTDTHKFFDLFLTRWLIGAVARAYEPRGCQNRMLVLDGEQGIGKSYFVRWLAEPTMRPELYIEGPINPDDKDSSIRLMTAWIWEVSELGSTTRRQDRESLKYFLSQQWVTVRKPYGHYDLTKKALTNFVGTVNNIAGFLDDPSGYRRFMAAQLTAIDWGYTEKIDPKQVWAQAKALYDKGEPWTLDDEEAKFAEFISAQYEMPDPLEDFLRRNYDITRDPMDFEKTIDILDTLSLDGWRYKGSPRGAAMTLGATMKRLGLYSEREKTKEQARGYVGIKKR